MPIRQAAVWCIGITNERRQNSSLLNNRMNYRSLQSCRALHDACQVIWHDGCLPSRVCANEHSKLTGLELVAEFVRIQPTTDILHLKSCDFSRGFRIRKDSSTLPGSDECPHWLERSIPPGSAQAGASDFGSKQITQANRMPTKAWALYSAWERPSPGISSCGQRRAAALTSNETFGSANATSQKDAPQAWVDFPPKSAQAGASHEERSEVGGEKPEAETRIEGWA